MIDNKNRFPEEAEKNGECITIFPTEEKDR
jgi:hypothetical protein